MLESDFEAAKIGDVFDAIGGKHEAYLVLGDERTYA